MNNLRKIGLSALAGSLATFSVNAADVSVSGGASITFDDSNRGKGDRGNGFYMGDSLNFAMSGETDGGIGIAVNYEIDGGTLDDYNVKMSGDWGSLNFAGHGGSSAFGAIDDKTPNAYEEAWAVIDTDGTATSGSATVINGGGGNNMFVYTSPSMGGATLSVAYQNDPSATAESYSDFSLVMSPEGIDGLTIGAASAQQEVDTADSLDLEETTMFVTYAFGSMTVGVQASDYDHDTAGSDLESQAIGISYAVSDDISVSYNIHNLETATSGDDDQESTGISASFTSGGMTIAGSMNQVDNIAGTATRDAEGYEFTMSFAF